MKTSVCAIALLLVFALPLFAPPNIGDPAPDFTLPDTLGTNHTLSDYQHNVIFLNFGESW